LFVPLLIVLIIKQNVKATPERKKKVWYRVFNFFATMTPFMAIIIGAHIAWQIKSRDHYNSPTHAHAYYAKQLKIVGIVTPGLNILRKPNILHPWGEFFADMIPLTLIAFMESYSVARRIAVQNNELHILNASQELWANGCANLLGSVSSAYPVSGSFSRSSLNYASGARTPMSKVTTLCVILTALGTLTRTFQYIPQAALAAVIWVAITTLINVSDFWECWRHSKKDFFTMSATFAIVFIFDTSIGLAVGIGCSVLVYLVEVAFSRITAPLLVASCKDNSGVDIVKLEGDLTFLTSARVKDFIAELTITVPPKPNRDAGTSEYLFGTVSGAFDAVLRPHLLTGVDELPKAIVVDMALVRLIDITGIQALSEAMQDARRKGCIVVIYNVHEEIQRKLVKFGIKNDSSRGGTDVSEYLSLGTSLIPVIVSSSCGDVEFGLVVSGAHKEGTIAVEEPKDSVTSGAVPVAVDNLDLSTSDNGRHAHAS
jgi:MFS superfamily sulfate permease-like transporter